MKLSKNKIIVSALALAIGASLAGSVGSTIAWYQYSTRANASFLGEASGFSANLQLRFKGENDTKWRTRITKEEMAANLVAGTGSKLVPLTFGGLNYNEALPVDGEQNLAAYKQPVAGIADMSKWAKAEKSNYAQFQLELRYVERDGDKEGGAKDDKNVEKKVYLSQMLLQEDPGNDAVMAKGDLSEAIRVHVSAAYNDGAAHVDNKLISKSGGSTVTHGYLDLDADGKKDSAYADDDEFGFKDGAELEELDYGDAKTQKAFAGNATGGNHSYIDNNDQAQNETTYPAIVGRSNDSNVLSDTDKQAVEGIGDVEKYIGKTMESESQHLTVTVTVWVEGWHRFDYSARQGSPKFDAIWDTDLIGAKFDLGLQFAVQDASVAE